MRTLLLGFTVLAFLTLPLTAGQSAKKPAQSTATKTAAKKPAAKKTTTKKKTTVASVQQHPTLERYAEIQQALVDRGYLEKADGKWDAASVEALKKFQEDQELSVDGKIGALSLMALGLGPRRGAFVVAASVPNLNSPAPVE